MSADRNAKRLRIYIAENSDRHTLRALKITQWVNHDRLETDCPIEISVDCFFYTSIKNADKSFNGIECVLTGIIGFLVAEREIQPSPADLSELKAILAEIPLTEDRFRNWLVQVFG